MHKKQTIEIIGINTEYFKLGKWYRVIDFRREDGKIKIAILHKITETYLQFWSYYKCGCDHTSEDKFIYVYANDLEKGLIKLELIENQG
jgi:hypothetical protein